MCNIDRPYAFHVPSNKNAFSMHFLMFGPERVVEAFSNYAECYLP